MSGESLRSVLLSLSRQRASEPRRLADATFAPKQKWPLPQTKGFVFENVDFNSPVIGTFLIKPRFSECNFVGCNLDGLNVSKTEVIGSVFRSCILGAELVGSVTRSAFSSCEFADCSVAAIHFDNCILKECRFADCSFERVTFNTCTLDTVSITGRLRTVNFVDCPMRKVDLSQAVLFDSTVRDRSDQDVRLPDRPDNFFASASAFTGAMSSLRGGLSTRGFEEYRSLADYYAKSAYGECVDEEMFSDMSANDRTQVMKVLYELRNTRSST